MGSDFLDHSNTVQNLVYMSYHLKYGAQKVSYLRDEYRVIRTSKRPGSGGRDQE